MITKSVACLCSRTLFILFCMCSRWFPGPPITKNDRNKQTKWLEQGHFRSLILCASHGIREEYGKLSICHFCPCSANFLVLCRIKSSEEAMGKAEVDLYLTCQLGKALLVYKMWVTSYPQSHGTKISSRSGFKVTVCSERYQRKSSVHISANKKGGE